jgi:hypothetical protein
VGSTYNFYKRLQTDMRFDLYSNFADTWTDADNVLGTNFQLYST